MSTETLGPRQRAAITKRTRTQQQISSAARYLFDGCGWDAVTVEDIAQRAGVSAATIDNHYSTKRTIALAAYSADLQPVINKAVQAKKVTAKTITEFIRELAEVLIDHPVLTVALLPATRDFFRRSDRVRPGEVDVIDFDQLVELISRLLEAHWNAKSSRAGSSTEVAEFCLFGMLPWLLRHPARSERATRLALNGLL